MTKNYNEIEVKDNMKINDKEEEVVSGEKEKFESIVTAQPKKAKKSLLGRLVTGVVGPDGLPGIGAYVNEEIIKPAFKDIVVNSVISGINMLVYGDRGHGPTRGGGGYNTHRGYGYSRPSTNYNNRYSPNTSPRPSSYQEDRRPVPNPRRGGVEEYILDRHDASQVLVSLTESAERYGHVSVADYYDLIGVPSQFTDNQYGWTYENIIHANIVPSRGGFLIRLPNVEVI